MQRRMVDTEPGAAPEVRRDGDNTTFLIDVAGAPEKIKLVLRCTPTAIYAAVRQVQDRPDEAGPEST